VWLSLTIVNQVSFLANMNAEGNKFYSILCTIDSFIIEEEKVKGISRNYLKTYHMTSPDQFLAILIHRSRVRLNARLDSRQSRVWNLLAERKIFFESKLYFTISSKIPEWYLIFLKWKAFVWVTFQYRNLLKAKCMIYICSFPI